MPHNSKHILLLFSLISFSYFSSNGQNFEGTIEIKNTIPNTLNVVFTIKNEKAMMETVDKTGRVKMISDAKTGQKITITEKDGEEVIVIKDSNDMQYRNLNKRYEKRNTRTKNPSVKVTKETKIINGFKCYKVIGNDRRYDGVAWITQDFEVDPSALFPITKLENRSLPKIAKDLRNSMKGFVMELSIKNKKTKKEDKLTVNIQKKPIAPESFKVDMKGKEVYSEENVRELMKSAKGNPEKMKKARDLIAQIRMQ